MLGHVYARVVVPRIHMLTSIINERRTEEGKRSFCIPQNFMTITVLRRDPKNAFKDYPPPS